MSETDQDRADREMAQAQQADMEAFQREAQEALDASVSRPLTKDEVSILAWMARLQTPEIRYEQK